ncbi:hypothetical protein N9M96_00445 [Euryarchaeota archaeon]|nr:hypothetical protein [Euryarchaeota archaeon]
MEFSKGEPSHSISSDDFLEFVAEERAKKPNIAVMNHATSRIKNAHSSIRYARIARMPEPTAMSKRYDEALLCMMLCVSRKKAQRMRNIPRNATVSELKVKSMEAPVTFAWRGREHQ